MAQAHDAIIDLTGDDEIDGKLMKRNSGRKPPKKKKARK
jgi:hypothetical protein